MDEQAFDDFYAASFPRITGQLYAMIGNRDEAQECVQEAFVRAWAHRRKLDRAGHPEAWVRTTAYRLAVSRWRRAQRGRRPADRALGGSGDSHEISESRVALVAALRQLPEAQRLALVLHHVCDLPIEAVAREVGAPPKAPSRPGSAAAVRRSRPCCPTAHPRAPAASRKERAMPDPINELESLGTQVLDVNPLPAAEVRRRGDRMRRRQAVLVSVGAAAAVAVVVAPLAVLAGGEDHAAPQPTNPSITSPSIAPDSVAPTPVEGAWLSRIPDDLDLAMGYPEDSQAETEEMGRQGPSRSLDPLSLEACDQSLVAEAAADRLTAGWTNVEDFRSRELTLWDSDLEASAWVRRVLAFYGRCPEQTGSDGYTYRYVVHDGSIGQESALVTQEPYFQGARAIGLEVVQVVRVGNAVLVDTTGNEGGLTDAAIRQAIQQGWMSIEPLVAKMDETFAAVPGSDPEVASLSEAALLEADQLPARARLTAWRQVPPVDAPTLACQPERLSALGADAMVHREFRANIAGSGADGEAPAAGVNLAVLAFADEAATSSAYDTVAGWVDDCSSPEDDSRPLAQKVPGANRTEVDGGRAEWRQRDFLGTDVCAECDAVWFDRMGVAQVGNRLVLVSLAELGGPLEPEGLDATMTGLFAAAIDQARP